MKKTLVKFGMRSRGEFQDCADDRVMQGVRPGLSEISGATPSRIDAGKPPGRSIYTEVTQNLLSK